MTKTKSTKSALLMSTLAMVLCISMLIGTTFAWFTDSVTSSNNRIVAGNLDIELYYQNDEKTEWTKVNDTTNIFKENTLWEPGHTEVIKLKIANEGSLALKYQLGVNIVKETGSINVEGDPFKLSDSIYFGVVDGAQDFERASAIEAVRDTAEQIKTGCTQSSALLKEESVELTMVVYMPTTIGNEANHAIGEKIPEILLGLNLYAAQFTFEADSFDNQYDAGAEYPVITKEDTWDGTADFGLFGLPRDATEEEISNVDLNENEYVITSAEALVAFASLVDAGNTFEGKTVKLACNMDLEFGIFNPIGSYRFDCAFKGTFDGQNHAIKNLSQNTWALNNGYYYNDCGLGLFGLVEDATIKNLTIDGADISGESAICGLVAACASGDMIFENIKVINSKGADYQYYSGGIVGWASGNHKYIGCEIDVSTTIAAQWGDFDNSTGGVIGGTSGNAQIYMKDCKVACRIDAYNDVTSSYQWYAYRRCGMLIGNTGKTTDNNGATVATAPQLTCENVTVTYEDWANYTYCEFAGTSWPYVRVQAGISNSAYSNPRYGHPTDANGNEVVDNSHVHNEGEDHFILCAFDQLYGGGQGVYGTATHPGVTVVYNNK